MVRCDCVLRPVDPGRSLWVPPAEDLSYSDFKVLLKAGQVEDLTLEERAISGRLKREGLEGVLTKEKVEKLQRSGQAGYHFVTVRVNDPTLIQELEASRVHFAGREESTWFPILLDRLDVLLGGRVAEELSFGDVSTGAQNDLQRATDLVHLMVTQYGMSERLGLGTFEEPRTSAFLDISIPHRPRGYSEQTAQVIDEEIRTLLADAHTRVQETLTGYGQEEDIHCARQAGLGYHLTKPVDLAQLERILSTSAAELR